MDERYHCLGSDATIMLSQNFMPNQRFMTGYQSNNHQYKKNNLNFSFTVAYYNFDGKIRVQILFPLMKDVPRCFSFLQ